MQIETIITHLEVMPARAVFGISNWPESLGEEFLVFRVLPAETDAEAITRAESAYSPDIELIIKDYQHV